MGLFGTILSKLGIGDNAPAPASTAPASPAAATAAPVRPKGVLLVDVVANLEQRAAANPQKLNWRTSIVDLLRLLDMDSSFAARRDLAREMNCPRC
jgi:hypothetical protein